MTLRSVSIYLLFLLFLYTSGVVPAAFALDARDAEDVQAAQPEPEASGPPAPESAANLSIETSLADVLIAKTRLETDLTALQSELRSDRARGRETELERDIRSLAQEQLKLDRSFSELASGFDPDSLSLDHPAAALNLTNELRDLLGPLVNELKRATNRPREIDRLRTNIAQTQEQLEKVSAAQTRVAALRTQVRDPAVIAALATEKEDWSRRASALQTTLKVDQQKLDQRIGESQTIRETVENVFQLFFKSRGRNLLVALLATLGFLFGLRQLRVFLARRPTLNRHSSSFRGRIFSLVYTAFTVLGALLVFLLALYLFGDWVLLILMLLLLLGVIWTSKQAIPRFWGQCVLLLDMGPVREGERVIYNGLPWRIDFISFYTALTNPALAGGEIRLPIDDLSGMRSRASQDNEAWFPTQKGDVILYLGERAAEIEFQSVEIVKLKFPGESHVVVPTPIFLANSIELLSDGYRVGISFGLDYNDQANITTSMLDILGREIDSRWRGTRWADSLVSSSVEFQTAGASSLDLFVRVDLDGTSAIAIEAQKRMLASFCVDVCNDQGWTIPFSQLTLHVATDASDSTD